MYSLCICQSGHLEMWTVENSCSCLAEFWLLGELFSWLVVSGLYDRLKEFGVFPEVVFVIFFNFEFLFF